MLVSNCYIANDMKDIVESETSKYLCKKFKNNYINFVSKSSIEILKELIKFEKDLEQGKRLGSPALDLVREINRFMNPRISYAGNKTQAKQVKNEILGNLKELFGIN
jgi:hypothetical protein